MCQAFAESGAEVTLLHPFRHQKDATLRGVKVFEYYGVPQLFEVRKLPNLDVILLEQFFPKDIFKILVFVHGMLWGLYVSFIACREQADLYYTRDSVIAFWLTWLRLPTVYEAHVVSGRRERLLVKRFVRRQALKLAVVLTSFIKASLVEFGLSQDRVIVAPDGVDLLQFRDLPSKRECRIKLDLPLRPKIIGYIGRFKTMGLEKGIPELVRAMAHLQSVNGAEPLLLCVGGPMDPVPWYLALAQQTGVQQKRLKFVNRVPNWEVPFWIRACDVVTIPWTWTDFSAYYTSPLKLFEYMAAGVPTVATDLPSLREVLRHGQNAWLVKPNSPEALARGIRRLLSNSDLALKLAANARREVEKYSWYKRALTILKCLSTTKID
jgi:glycosyltransferase involved in cell wall biosynthesis